MARKFSNIFYPETNNLEPQLYKNILAQKLFRPLDLKRNKG